MNNNDDKSNVNVPEAYQSTPTVGGLPWAVVLSIFTFWD